MVFLCLTRILTFYKAMNKNNHILFCLVFLMGCGGGGGSSVAAEQVNTAPQLIGLIDFAIDENTSEITTIQATDVEGDNITYSIDGSDSGLMTIGSVSGELSFISPQIMKIQRITIKIIFMK